MLGGFFKGIGNAVAAPFKSAGNILRGKFSIGDIVNVGTPFLPGGNIAKAGFKNFSAKNLGLNSLLGSAGIKDPSKMTAMDAVSMASRFGGAGGGAQRQNPPMSLNDSAAQIASGYIPAAMQEAQFINDNMGQSLGYRQDAADYLGGAYDSTLGSLVRNEYMGAGRSAGQASANQLGAQGYGTGVQDGARLEAINNATQAANEFMASLYSPKTRAERSMTASQILSSPTLAPQVMNMIGSAQGLLNAQRQLDEQFRKPTVLEQFLDVGAVAASVIPSEKWDEWF